MGLNIRFLNRGGGEVTRGNTNFKHKLKHTRFNLFQVEI